MVFAATVNIVPGCFYVTASVISRLSIPPACRRASHAQLVPSPAVPSAVIVYALEALCSRQQWRGTAGCGEVQKETFISEEAAIKPTGAHRLTAMSWAGSVGLMFGCQFVLTEERCYLWLRSGLLGERNTVAWKKSMFYTSTQAIPFSLYRVLPYNLIFTYHIN